MILLALIKDLSTGRLQRTRANLQSATPEILQVLGEIYIDKVHRWQSFLERGGALNDVELSLLALKVLRRLLVAGYENPNRHKEVQEFWLLTANHFSGFLNIVMQEPPIITPKVRTVVGQHLLQLAKLHLDMTRTHPAAFALLPDSVTLGHAYASLIFRFGEALRSESTDPSAALTSGEKSESSGKYVLEQLSLKGFLVLRACMKMMFNPVHTFKYQHAEDKEERQQSKELMKSQLLTEELAYQLMETVVTRYFVLRPLEIKAWMEEPEEWERSDEADGDAWEYSLRLCSEKFMLDLLINLKELLAHRLLNFFYSVSCE